MSTVVNISALGVNPLSAGTDFRRQILTSKVDHRTKGLKYL